MVGGQLQLYAVCTHSAGTSHYSAIVDQNVNLVFSCKGNNSEMNIIITKLMIKSHFIKCNYLFINNMERNDIDVFYSIV